MTAATSMPTMRASAGFSLTARIARPIWLRVSRRCMAPTSSAVRPSEHSWSGVTRMPAARGIAIWISRLK
jgi:hypothetical protein